MTTVQSACNRLEIHLPEGLLGSAIDPDWGKEKDQRLFISDSFSCTVQCPLSLAPSALRGILCPSENKPSSHLSCFYEPVDLHHICLSIIYIKGETGPSPQYLIALLVCQGKNWAQDERRTLCTSQDLETISSGRDNKEGVEFLCFVKG